MTPTEFIKKWKPAALTERAAAQSHFNDLCALVGHENPISADPAGEWFAFEKGVTKTGSGNGFADVWKRNYFAWEYKKRDRDLNAALGQLVRYAAALENPPLQVACDTDRFLIRTAWTNAVPKTYEFTLDQLIEPDKLDILHSVFFDPEKLRPKETRAALTKEAADKFSTVALRLQGAGTPEEIAHFVNQLVFCFFASSAKLLPDGFFPKLLKRAAQKPDRARDYFNQLFAAMETGGEFDLTDIVWFNGGLFDGRRALKLESGDIGLLQAAATLDWSQIDPTIFGTLFERFLEPDKRAQIGAHYTDETKIMMIVEPVILRPLREEWAAAKAEIESLLAGKAKPPKGTRKRPSMSLGETAAEEVRSRYLERLKNVSILDPACGSGNFLYLALQGVKDIENRANLECEALGLPPRVNEVGPEILHGIEINPIAAELARTTIWIGEIQWRRRNGIYYDPPPILRKLDTIECRDALIESAPSPISGEAGPSRQARVGRGRERSEPVTSSPGTGEAESARSAKPGDGPGEWREAPWPEAEFIVGNPPFLGGKLLRSGLGDETVETLFEIYKGRVPPEADLVTYWFEKARAMLDRNCGRRVGLVATQSIRRGSSQAVLDRIVQSTRIFDAWADEEWAIDGADVRVSLVCFGYDARTIRLDGKDVTDIFSDLSAGARDLGKACTQMENSDASFQGVIKTGPFDVTGEVARKWLQLPLNPNGKPNADVLKPWFNGDDIAGRWSDHWIIDFGVSISEKDASLYQAPFEYIKAEVFEKRQGKREKRASERWWLLQRARPQMRTALRGFSRFAVTPRVAKYRIFAWLSSGSLPDTRLVVFARDDYAFFGILHSRFHEAWSLRLGGWHGVGNDPQYTPTLGFETFPFPEGLTPNIPAADYASDPRAQAIARAAKRLDDLRNAWLNPPDLVRIEPEVVPTAAQRAAGAEKLYPDRILPKDAAAAAKLKERTLTKLYNQRPQWLADAHRDLDAAVAAAYRWPADISEEDALANLLALNLERARRQDEALREEVSPLPARERVSHGSGEGPLIGREAFAKISEMEGVRLSDEEKEIFADFDRRKVPHEERRRAIIERFRRDAAE